MPPETGAVPRPVPLPGRHVRGHDLFACSPRTGRPGAPRASASREDVDPWGGIGVGFEKNPRATAGTLSRTLASRPCCHAGVADESTGGAGREFRWRGSLAWLEFVAS